ncbi:MAG TPA: hypothetical protein VFC92_02805 [Bacteroidales bacterium]|nr:hypothetical protein [Bacteroidales bacterium]
MKNLTIQTRNSKLLLMLLLFATFAMYGCRVTFVPEYDATLATDIKETARQVDKFYLMMLETTRPENDGRAFELFVPQYVDIEVMLGSLLNQNKIKPLNQNSTRIVEITLELWQKYKEEHRSDNTLSNGLIKLNRKTFSDLFYAMQVAEKGKELATNPPE